MATATSILLVEDNPGDAELIRSSLAELDGWEFELACATRLSAALERLGAERPVDVVLLDLSLPDSDGLEGLAVLKQRAPHAPIVVLTGRDDEGLALGALRSGAQDYLVKGKVDSQLLRRSLLYAIERRQGEIGRVRLAEERAARAAAERAHARAALLADASIVLSSSLDSTHTLASLAALAVPRFADCSAIALYGVNGELERLLVRHHDPEKTALLERLCRVVLRPTGSPCVGDLTQREEPVFLPDISESWLTGHVPATELLELALALAPQSVILVPLRLRGKPLGVFAFALTGCRRYEPDDLLMGEDLARRVELAVDNSRLFDEAQRAITEARQSLKVRDEFMAVAAHELRTPLTPLMLRLSSLQKTYAEPRPDIEAGRLGGELGKTLKAADRLSKLVENLLDFSRLNSGQLSLVREDMDLCELAREVAARFSDEAARAGSTLNVWAKGRVPGKWDRLRIDQVLTNLLSNAIKYGAGRPIDVSVLSDAGTAWLEVHDRGIGIDDRARQAIFGRFERAVSTREYGGLGLGLYITKEIVTAHEGSIDVASKLGVGSSFTVTLPRQPGDAPGTRPASVEQAQTD